jgi:ABC-2 type transport system permease protein
MIGKLRALLRRDLLTVVHYRTSLVLHFAGILGEVAGLYFLARAVGPGFRPDGLPFFPFLLVGSSFYLCLIGGVQVFVETVRTAQMTGTLEVLLSTSTHDTMVILLMATSAFFGRLCQLLLAFAAACLLFGLKLSTSHIVAFILIFSASIIVVVALGLLASAIQIWTGRGSSLVWLLASFGALISGTLFPVSVLPRPVQLLAEIFPVTHSLDGMRLALLSGASIQGFAVHLAWLAAYALVLVPLSLLLLSHVLRRARHEGTLAIY